jgi:phosphoribosyl 1,2-cyclic phosphodiesterase
MAVLASGSSGNATLLETDGFSVLIDVGLGPRQIATRLAAVGASWQKVNAVVLTHTHSDHWRDRTFEHLRRLKIPLFCHAEHREMLDASSAAFKALTQDGLVHAYKRERELRLCERLCCRPFELQHDSVPTFGFRFEGGGGLFGPSWSMAYAADLGSWSKELVAALADADVLAIEFNHDEHMERTSGRPRELIDRVLGDFGHLSNVQAAELLAAIMSTCANVSPRHLIQLHLSRECNRPTLAVAAVRKVVDRHDITVHTAAQHRVGPILSLDGKSGVRRRTTRTRVAGLPITTLPGMD